MKIVTPNEIHHYIQNFMLYKMIVVYIPPLLHKMKIRKTNFVEFFRGCFLGRTEKNQKYDKILRDLKLQFLRLIIDNNQNLILSLK